MANLSHGCITMECPVSAANDDGMIGRISLEEPSCDARHDSTSFGLIHPYEPHVISSPLVYGLISRT